MPWPPKVLDHTTAIKNKPPIPKFLLGHKETVASDGGPNDTGPRNLMSRMSLA